MEESKQEACLIPCRALATFEEESKELVAKKTSCATCGPEFEFDNRADYRKHLRCIEHEMKKLSALKDANPHELKKLARKVWNFWLEQSIIFKSETMRKWIRNK